MTKREFLILFVVFSILFVLPVWLVEFLPFVDLPQHLNFVHILRNYHNPKLHYNKIYVLRLFPTHNTFHLFFNYLLSFLFPLAIANKIYLTISILLFPLALWFLIKQLGGNEQFALLGFLFSYNYNLFWGFLGVNVGIPLILFLIGLEISSLTRDRVEFNLLLMTILFVMLFLCHSLVYIFSVVVYLVILLFNLKLLPWRKRISLTLPFIISFVITFLPWQAKQFRGEGSELQEQVRQYISPSALWQNIMNLFQRIGIKTDQSLIFIFKITFILAILTTFNLIRQKGVRQLWKNNYRMIFLFILITLIFYLFFPGEYTEAVFLNERFAPLLFLLFITLLALNFSNLNNRILRYILILIPILVGINILVRFILFGIDTKDLKAMISRLNERGKLVGLFYQRRPKPDYFGYDVYIHFPCYYQIYRQGLCGFSFAYIRYSPIVYEEPNPLPRIDEWTTWNSIFPNNWTIYDYFLVYGEPRLQDEDIIKKWRKVEEKGNWRIYENLPVKKAWEEINNWLSQKDLSKYNRILIPPFVDEKFIQIPTHLKRFDYQTVAKMILTKRISASDIFPCLAIWLKDDNRDYAEIFGYMNTNETFNILEYQFTPIYNSTKGYLIIYDIR
ncbi:MAG: hypothetical protein ABIK93_01635 [candidate division WOR-3 bacterium]